MGFTVSQLQNTLKHADLKVTPQRLAVLEAIYVLNNHPTAENIVDYIRQTHPNIATGTVYKVLDALVVKKIIQKVKTEKDIMRYDGMMHQHHHLYCSESDRIEDYRDDDLDKLLRDYFQNKGVPGFEIEEIKLQLNGRFSKRKK